MMTVYYGGGGDLMCGKIEIEGGNLIADDYRIIPIEEVWKIVCDDYD